MNEEDLNPQTAASEPATQPAPAEPIPAPIAEIAAEPEAEAAPEPEENFADILKDFERTHVRKPEAGAAQLQGTVVSLTADQVFLDIGYKT